MKEIILAVLCWNRLFGWFNNCNETGETKVKLCFLLDQILPILKAHPNYKDITDKDYTKGFELLTTKQNEFLNKLKEV